MECRQEVGPEKRDGKLKLEPKVGRKVQHGERDERCGEGHHRRRTGRFPRLDSAYHVGQIVLIARILAGDQWATITIPRSASAGFSQRVWGTGHYQTPKPEER